MILWKILKGCYHLTFFELSSLLTNVLITLTTIIIQNFAHFLFYFAPYYYSDYFLIPNHSYSNKANKTISRKVVKVRSISYQYSLKNLYPNDFMEIAKSYFHLGSLIRNN